MKGKVYKMVLRPAMLSVLETEAELEVAKLKMLRYALGVNRLGRTGNEDIRGMVQVGQFEDNVREERLCWFGHVQRGDAEDGAARRKEKRRS